MADAAEPAPAWFRSAIAQTPQSRFVDSDGTRLHYLSWNAADTDKPGLLFAHGYLGHAHWWDFIAPFFTARYRVYALDFSGMGESGHRTAYRNTDFVGDLVAVLADAGMSPGIVVGHSFGGSRLMQACALRPECFTRAIVLDSYFMLAGETLRERTRPQGRRPYADEATARAHFRLQPDQDCPPWLMDHLARHSLKHDEAGWVWRFDRALREAMPPDAGSDLLGSIRVPVDYVHAELSRAVPAERARVITAAIPGARGPITMPGTHHHMMLDQPLALVSLLRGLLGGP